jgi:cyclophilin family peptidyl-prolyl cis-trans isomerase/HEAT repeat protein
MNRFLFSFLLLLLIIGCIPPKEEMITEVSIDLTDPLYRKILEYQDKQKEDSLFFFLHHVDPSYRYAAAKAFASIRNASAIDSLTPLLQDPIPEVRKASAFALGQIGDSRAENALIASFNTLDTLSPNHPVNAEILGAIGKCGKKESLNFIATVQSYRPTDTLLLYGQADAIYRFGLRDITTESGTEKMVDFLSSNIYPTSVRLLAASYVKRSPDIDLSPFTFRLNKAFSEEDNPFIKMDLAIALGQTKDASSLSSLLTELHKNNDYRVKTNIVRALGNFTYIDVVETVIEQLNNPNVAIAQTAAQFLVDHGQPNDVIIYRRHAKEDLPWQVRSKIYEAIIKHVPTYFSKTRGASLWDIRKLIESSSNPYEKAAYIRAMGYDHHSLAQIRELGFDANELPARTAAMEAFNSIIVRDDLESQMNRYQFRRFKEEVAEMMEEAFKSEDTGMIALAASGFRDCSFDLTENFDSLDFISDAKQKLTLPEDVESYNEILKLESQLKNEEYKPVEIGFNHPIQWKFYDALSPESKAIVETDRGSFEISLLRDNAPGSVVNFVRLVEDGYYEGKRFHRVVPNFVIQTGCSRGDGWGSLDYSIRSELSMLSYDDEGYVGMASAGNHTESSQWFVTHSPTLHLDGNYSILGKVSRGMNTVHSIQVGDVIQSVQIVY